MKFWQEKFNDGCKWTFLENDILRQDDVILATTDDVKNNCAECLKMTDCLQMMIWLKREWRFAVLDALQQENAD